MKIHDISQEVFTCTVFPGDILPERRVLETIEDGNSVLPFVSKLLVKRANKQWKKENHTLSYDEYLR